MMDKKDWRKRVYNYISKDDRQATINKMEAIREATRKLDREGYEKEKSEGRSYQWFWKLAVPTMDQIGTEAAFDNLISHIRKGCFADPLSVKSMSYPAHGRKITDGTPRPLFRRRGTNIVETDNQHSEEAVTGSVKRQRSKLTDMKLLLYVTEHNLKCDAKVEHIFSRPPLPRLWFIRRAIEEDLEDFTRTPFGEKVAYPPELDLEVHMEPIGEVYQQYCEWAKVDSSLRELYCQAVGTNYGDYTSFAVNHSDPVYDDEVRDPAPAPAPEVEDAMPVSHDSPPASPASEPEQPQQSAQAAQPTEVPLVARAPVQESPQKPAPSPMTTDYTQQGFSAWYHANQQQKSSPRKRPAVNLLGAERWGTRKSGIDLHAVNQQYIHGRLNSMQLKYLNDAYTYCMTKHGPGTSTELIANEVAQVFNHWHTHYVTKGGGGLGGYITKKAVTRHLSQMGNQVIRQQLEQRVQHQFVMQSATVYSPPSGFPSLPSLTVQQVNQLGRKKCRNILKTLGKTQQGDLKGKVKQAYGMPMH